MISRELIAAIRLGEKRNYEIAHEAGLHPSTLSKLLCGIEKVRVRDSRIVAVGRVLGFREDQCFEEMEEK